MEFAALVTTFLAPFLPQLMKLGQPVAEGAGKALGTKLGEGSWEKAKQVWQKLWPGVAAKPLAKGAAEELAGNTEDEDARQVLTKQVEKLLAADPDLAAALQALLAEDEATVAKVVRVSQTVTGDRNIVLGQSDGSVNIRQG